MRSLFDFLGEVEDYGCARGQRYSLRTVLTLAIAARLAGYRGVTAFAEFADLLDQQQRRTVGYRQQRPLGAMLFQQGTLTLACRDRWIGWESDQYRHQLQRVVSQARFLLLPWVRVEHLASHALALAVRQLPADWHQQYRYQPVLIETSVDPQRFAGTCYRAANWLAIGQTQGRTDHPPKDVYLYPLTKDCRQILRAGPSRARPPTRVEVTPDAAFVQTWRELIDVLSRLARQHDQQWLKRRRVLDTLLVMLFVFRLVFAPRRLGYTATLAELWDHCRHLEVPLPQPHPVSAAAMTRARHKVDPQVFRQSHAAILRRCPQPPDHLWRGHRVFAIDGSKLTLPHPLLDAGYPLPHPQSHYPQGLLSCLYRLHSRLPVDFDLHAHGNQRLTARAHLEALSGSDLVVYDRGYYSFELLAAHHARQLPAVFRLQSHSGTPIAAYVGVGRQRPRPDRSVPRESKQPASRWSRRKSKKAANKA